MASGKSIWGGRGRLWGNVPPHTPSAPVPPREVGGWGNLAHASTTAAPAQYQPTMPDPGTYDPSFDLNRQNAQVGYDRSVGDFAVNWGELGAGANGGRMGADLATALGRAGQQQQWGDQNFDQQLSDLQTARQRGDENQRTSLADMMRGYARTATSQAEKIQAAGVAGGGTAAASMKARQANQGHDYNALSTAYQRFAADNTAAQSRVGDARTQFDTQAGWGTGDLNQQYGRGREDAITGAGRNATDLQNYLTGQSQLAYYSSGQPQRPVTIADLFRRRGYGS